MKEDRNTSQNVEEFGNQVANIVGYCEGVVDIWKDLEPIRRDLLKEKAIGEFPTPPGNMYELGMLAMEEKILELCHLRLSEAHQAQLELCEEINRRTSKHDS